MPAKVNYIGRAMWTHGTDEQKRRFLPTILTGDEMWCQGFSEPEAGSDIALVAHAGRARGRRVGGERSEDVDQRGRRSRLVLPARPHRTRGPETQGHHVPARPMDVPGISTRPIVLANGDPETAEVFFDDVRIPADQMLGERGEGWGIAMTTLAYERGPAMSV